MRAGRCSSCGALIYWIATPGGKSMPVDRTPVTYWAKDKASGKIVTPSGHVISCEFEGDFDKATGYGYISHFATCPKYERKKANGKQVNLFEKANKEALQ